MLSNCDHEKMALLISSTTNEWPQMQQDIQIDDIDHQRGLNNNNNAMSSSTSSPANRIMEKPGQEQLQLQQQALKCPRCDSSNTKFCYYNNYSLSQPRHFCKACKRYWTRGGTLRNVPVGGGCRKNKRVKRPGSTSSTSSAMDGGTPSSSSSVPSTTAAVNNNNSNPNSHPSHIDQINPLFYGLSSNPFMDTASGFDLHQLNHQAQLGLGFSSSSGTNMMSSDNYRNRFNPASNSSLPSNYSSMFSTSPSTTAPTVASVLASKFINGGAFKDIQTRGPQHNQYFQSLLPFEDLQIAAGSNGEAGSASKDVKVEDHGGQNRLEWNNNNGSSNVNGNMNCQNQITEMGLSDPTLYWNSSTLGSNWHDPANLGSSVSSLI